MAMRVLLLMLVLVAGPWCSAGELKPRPNIVFVLSDDHGVPRHNGVRTERYTLAHFYRTNEWELFDLREDPKQLRSVYGRPGYESVTRNLRSQLEFFKQQFRDDTE